MIKIGTALFEACEELERERGIAKDVIIASLEDAMVAAYKRHLRIKEATNIESILDEQSGEIGVFRTKVVVDNVEDPDLEISLEDAKEIDEDVEVDDEVKIEVTPEQFGRIAAQTAKQVITQRIRDAERNNILNEFLEKKGSLTTGIIQRVENRNVIVNIGKTDAIMPQREQIPGEYYKPGNRIRVFVLNVKETNRLPQVIVSHAHAEIVKELFELEVAEISDGSVKIEAMAREPGYRTKIAVSSSDPRIDPVGACVGAGGSRVKSIVRELGGEKIDVIKYSPDPKTLLEECIKPAVAKNVHIDAAEKKITFEVSEADLSIVIGKRGSNAKLTSRLLGWKLDIAKEMSGEIGIEQKVAQAAGSLTQILPQLTDEQAAILANNGINSSEAFEGVEIEDLVEMGFSRENAELILRRVNEYQQ